MMSFPIVVVETSPELINHIRRSSWEPSPWPGRAGAIEIHCWIPASISKSGDKARRTLSALIYPKENNKVFVVAMDEYCQNVLQAWKVLL